MRKPKRSGRRTGLPLVQAQHGGRHAFGAVAVDVDAVYRVPAVHVDGPGEWACEADKIAWTDEETGIDCVIRREATGGHLGGYVGVGPDHPLYGCAWSAIPAGLDIEVHGGITYSAPCDESGPPETSVCHVDHDGPRRGSSIWWLGFECNKITDLVPSKMTNPATDSALAHGVPRAYRDEGYVYGQVVDLARQLAAIANGRDKPQRISPSPPPLGLDPRRAGVRR